MTNKKNTTLVISLSIFAGLFIFIIIILSSIFLLSKYFNYKKNQTLSNALKWQETLGGMTEEPIATVPNEQAENITKEEGKINEIISNEIIDLKVNSLNKINLTSSKPLANTEFYKINLTLKNNSDEEQKLYLVDFSASNQYGNEFPLIIPEKDELNDLLDLEIILSPEQELAGSMIFEVGKNYKAINFLLDDRQNIPILIELSKP